MTRATCHVHRFNRARPAGSGGSESNMRPAHPAQRKTAGCGRSRRPVRAGGPDPRITQRTKDVPPRKVDAAEENAAANVAVLMPAPRARHVVAAAGLEDGHRAAGTASDVVLRLVAQKQRVLRILTRPTRVPRLIAAEAKIVLALGAAQALREPISNHHLSAPRRRTEPRIRVQLVAAQARNMAWARAIPATGSCESAATRARGMPHSTLDGGNGGGRRAPLNALRGRSAGTFQTRSERPSPARGALTRRTTRPAHAPCAP